MSPAIEGLLLVLQSFGLYRLCGSVDYAISVQWILVYDRKEIELGPLA